MTRHLPIVKQTPGPESSDMHKLSPTSLNRAAVERTFIALVAVVIAILFGILLHLERTRIVGYWIEHCVDKYRPKYQEEARRGCEEEAERWRYGTEARALERPPE